MLYNYNKNEKAYNKFEFIADAAMESGKVEEIKSYIIPPQLSYMIHGVDNHPNPFAVDDYIESFDKANSEEIYSGIYDVGILMTKEDGERILVVNKELPTMFDLENIENLNKENIIKDISYNVYMFDKNEEILIDNESLVEKITKEYDRGWYDTSLDFIIDNFEMEEVINTDGENSYMLGLDGTIELVKDFFENENIKEPSYYEEIDKKVINGYKIDKIPLEKDNEDYKDFQNIINEARNIEEVSYITALKERNAENNQFEIKEITVRFPNEFKVNVAIYQDGDYAVCVSKESDPLKPFGNYMKCTKDEATSMISKVNSFEREEKISFDELKEIAKADYGIDF